MDLRGKNANITIKATKIPGARELLKGQPAPCEGLFIPIDNRLGVCCNGYTKKLPDGCKTTEFLEHVELNFTAYAFREENKLGATHGIKPSPSSEALQGMLQEQVRSIPWVGFLTPWSTKYKGGKK